MWWDFVGLEVLCEFVPLSRAHRARLEEAIDRATVTGRDLDGLPLPWAQRPDHARREVYRWRRERRATDPLWRENECRIRRDSRARKAA